MKVKCIHADHSLLIAKSSVSHNDVQIFENAYAKILSVRIEAYMAAIKKYY